MLGITHIDGGRHNVSTLQKEQVVHANHALAANHNNINKPLTPLQLIVHNQSMHVQTLTSNTQKNLAPQHAAPTNVTSKPTNLQPQVYEELQIIPEIPVAVPFSTVTSRPAEIKPYQPIFELKPTKTTANLNVTSYEDVNNIAAAAVVANQQDENFQYELLLELKQRLRQDALHFANNITADRLALAHQPKKPSENQQQQQQLIAEIDANTLNGSRDKTISDAVKAQIRAQQNRDLKRINLVKHRKVIKPLFNANKISSANLAKFRKLQSLHTINHAPTMGAQIIAEAHKQYIARHTATRNQSLKLIGAIVAARKKEAAIDANVQAQTSGLSHRVALALEKKVLAARLQRNYKIRQEIFSYQRKKYDWVRSWLNYKMNKKIHAQKAFFNQKLHEHGSKHSQSTKALTNNRIDKILNSLQLLKHDINPSHPIDRSV